MRGNPYSRGFDPMKSRSERRKEKQAKLAKTKRVVRLKKHLGRIAARKFAGQEDSHMTALMESYILRRKAERAAEKAKKVPQDGPGGPGETRSSATDDAVEESERDENRGSDGFSVSTEADSAFELDNADDDNEGYRDDISTSRGRAAASRQPGHVRGGNGPLRGSARGRGGASTAARKDTAPPHGKRGRGSAVDRGGGGARDSGRVGESAQQRQNPRRNARFHERSCRVLTRSLY
ncbi:hypothetical protein GH5_03147 [Leishmania sp. Ghana 2012 LV757]|uniref:hypothetical protein n=1 Tax=Leishmania sp. Ghana 2012 LV757 TaxID=2803181 RepID=UPI001B78D2EA|nr:hypothetical protein GH5_03147 [Leishmania sp. Ghana 2012 LV757]